MSLKPMLNNVVQCLMRGLDYIIKHIKLLNVNNFVCEMMYFEKYCVFLHSK